LEQDAAIIKAAQEKDVRAQLKTILEQINSVLVPQVSLYDQLNQLLANPNVNRVLSEREQLLLRLNALAAQFKQSIAGLDSPACCPPGLGAMSMLRWWTRSPLRGAAATSTTSRPFFLSRRSGLEEFPSKPPRHRARRRALDVADLAGARRMTDTSALYAVALSAQLVRGNDDVFCDVAARAIIATSVEEAEAAAYTWALEMWPVGRGWQEHKVAVATVMIGWAQVEQTFPQFVVPTEGNTPASEERELMM
jgi:hypothetical protein